MMPSIALSCAHGYIIFLCGQQKMRTFGNKQWARVEHETPEHCGIVVSFAGM